MHNWRRTAIREASLVWTPERRGRRRTAVDAARDYLASEAVVGRHLADQLLLPMALSGGGEFLTMPVTKHFESHVEIIGAFLSRRVVTENVGDLVSVRVG